MNREDIIRMAARVLELKEAHSEQLAWHVAFLEQDFEALEAEVERLRNAVAEEREACAKLVWATPEPDDVIVSHREAIVKAIRARGEK